MTINDKLQSIFREYAERMRNVATKHGLGKWLDNILQANRNNECSATEEEVEMMARLVDDDRLTRLEIPPLLEKSYRAKERDLRLIMENPWSEQTFLKQNFPFNPQVIDKDRTRRGDYYVKPTAYWFINCEPTYGYTFQPKKRGSNICQIPPNKEALFCGEERSMISPDYARNFICDFILGKKQEVLQLTIF